MAPVMDWRASMYHCCLLFLTLPKVRYTASKQKDSEIKIENNIKSSDLSCQQTSDTELDGELECDVRTRQECCRQHSRLWRKKKPRQRNTCCFSCFDLSCISHQPVHFILSTFLESHTDCVRCVYKISVRKRDTVKSRLLCMIKRAQIPQSQIMCTV